MNIPLSLNPKCIDDLAKIGCALEDAEPQEILRWAVASYAPKLTMATAFGVEGCVLMAMFHELGLHDKVDFFNLDTGYQFPETLEVRARIQEKYGIHVRLVQPAASVDAEEMLRSVPLYQTEPDKCCFQRKLVPLKGAVQGKDAWISSIRRDQTRDRRVAGMVEWDKKFELVKVNPLSNWTKDQVWDYVHNHDVPYNALHDNGYPSIGCWPCTHAVKHGEDDRAGRWSSFTKRECGLHTR